MLGTLTPPAGTLLRFSQGNRFSLSRSAGSDRIMPLPCRTKCKAALHAFAEAAPSVVDMRRPTSLYEVLRVNRNASPVEIKTAYRSLAKMYHPDASNHSSESDGRDFIEIHKAYATLSDPAARALYDLSLSAAGSGGRRPFRYSTATGYGTGFYTSRRWETDQCW